VVDAVVDVPAVAIVDPVVSVVATVGAVVGVVVEGTGSTVTVLLPAAKVVSSARAAELFPWGPAK